MHRACAFRPRLESLEDRAVPATFNVTTTLDVVDPADGKRSLREAIGQANTNTGDDIIVLPAGVFKITGASGDDMNGSGDFDIFGSVTIRGAGAGKTIVDGQQLDRVLEVHGSAPASITVVLEKLQVRSGKVTGNGGGIRVVDANLVVRDSAVVGNQSSGNGGGISNAGGSVKVTLVRSTIGRNAAGFTGGGVFVGGVDSVLTVNSSTVRRNVANQSGGLDAFTANLSGSIVSGNVALANGGGMSAGTATLTGCTVSGNTASNGDGGGVNAGTATLTNCTVSGNSAGGNAGGITAGTATLTNCTLSGNRAGAAGGGLNALTANLTGSTVSGNSAGTSGGGLFALTLNLTNSTVSGNSAGTNGGGIAAGTATLTNGTIVENIAQTGGGLFHSPGGAFSVKNTLIALNLVRVGGAGPDVNGTFISSGHNLIGDGTGAGMDFTHGVNGDIVGTSANPINPKIGALRNNGGRTATHALLAGSPAIDKGDNAGVPATDQRGIGFPRRKDGDGNGSRIVDIGAFER